jgi:hypothetical protein
MSMEIIRIFPLGNRWVVTFDTSHTLRHFESKGAALDFSRGAAASRTASIVRVLNKDGGVEDEQYFIAHTAGMGRPRNAAIDRPPQRERDGHLVGSCLSHEE